MSSGAERDIPRNWRGQRWRYSLGVRYPEGLEEAVKMNPVLTIAQLGLLTASERERVHKNLERSSISRSRIDD